MLSLGYVEVARICLTHSFNIQTIDAYVGNFDTTEEELKMMQDTLNIGVMEEYDKLIQLCDSLAGPDGVLDIEERTSSLDTVCGSPKISVNSISSLD